MAGLGVAARRNIDTGKVLGGRYTFLLKTTIKFLIVPSLPALPKARELPLPPLAILWLLQRTVAGG